MIAPSYASLRPSVNLSSVSYYSRIGPLNTKPLPALANQNSKVNNVKNIEGKATLSCTAKEGALTGEITFANCH